MRRALLLVAAAALIGAGAAVATTTLPGFRSPSRNIRCFRNLEAPILHCEIKQAAYAKRLVAYCAAPPIGVDWGGFELGPRRKASVTCTGGVLYSPGQQRLNDTILPYGKTWRSGPFTCVSRVTGVTCRSRSGHGMLVSRERYRLW